MMEYENMRDDILISTFHDTVVQAERYYNKPKRKEEYESLLKKIEALEEEILKRMKEGRWLYLLRRYAKIKANYKTDNTDIIIG